MKAGSRNLGFFLAISLWLTGCSSGSSENELITGPPGPDDTPRPAVISAISADNAVLLTRSALAMTGGLGFIADLATAMLHTGSVLLEGPYEGTMAIPQCAGSPSGSGASQNELRFWEINGNFDLPPGDALTAAFTNCEIGGFIVTGFLHVAAIERNGTVSDAGNWNLSATVAMSPIEIVDAGGGFVTYTDEFSYVAGRSAGVLTVDIEAPEDPGVGFIGGLNAQHHLTLAINNSTAVNYQFRPFRITTVDDVDSGEFRFMIRPNGDELPSLLNRYTLSPAGEIILMVVTDENDPLVWSDGKPDDYGETPDAGRIVFSEGDGSITADVTADGVDLTIDLGGAIVTETVDWETLLTPPSS